MCGKASIDAVEVACHRRPVSEPVSPAVIAGLTEGLGERQRWFATTGGLHAAGLFDLSGTPLVVREDVGRHNAVDKVIGWAAMAGALPADHRVLVVSGRASFEIVQKAAVAGIATVVAVSAPSSLAIDAARKLGVTLVGFARGDRFTAYAGAVGGVGEVTATVEIDPDRSTTVRASNEREAGMMAEVVFDHVREGLPERVQGGHRPQPEDRGGRVPGDGRAVRLRKVDDLAHDRRARGDHGRGALASAGGW